MSAQLLAFLVVLLSAYSIAATIALMVELSSRQRRRTDLSRHLAARRGSSTSDPKRSPGRAVVEAQRGASDNPAGVPQRLVAIASARAQIDNGARSDTFPGDDIDRPLYNTGSGR